MDCTGKSFCHELSIKKNMLSAIKERGRSASGMNQTHVSGVIIIILFLFFSLSLLLFLLPSVSFSLSVGTKSTGQRSQIGLNRAFLHQSCARWASSISWVLRWWVPPRLINVVTWLALWLFLNLFVAESQKTLQLQGYGLVRQIYTHQSLC